MTGSRVLLDTNIVIELFKGNSSIISRLKNRKSVDVPVAVLGELLLGAYCSSNPEKHLKIVNAFLEKCHVLVTDNETAKQYALIKAGLLRKGKPTPENDIWIAATAKRHNLKLVTSDKHFDEIDSIEIEKWTQIKKGSQIFSMGRRKYCKVHYP